MTEHVKSESPATHVPPTVLLEAYQGQAAGMGFARLQMERTASIALLIAMVYKMATQVTDTVVATFSVEKIQYLARIAGAAVPVNAQRILLLPDPTVVETAAVRLEKTKSRVPWTVRCPRRLQLSLQALLLQHLLPF